MSLKTLITCDAKGCDSYVKSDQTEGQVIAPDWFCISSSSAQHRYHICPKCVKKLIGKID